MATTQKAIAISRELADVLSKRLATLGTPLYVTEGLDSSGNPTLVINDGTPVAGEENFFIRIKPVEWALAKDILGNTATIFTPHVIQIATEAPAAGAFPGEYIPCTALLAVLSECVRKGCKVEWYQSANTVVPVVGTLVAGNLKASYEELYWGMLQSS